MAFVGLSSRGESSAKPRDDLDSRGVVEDVRGTVGGGVSDGGAERLSGASLSPLPIELCEFCVL